MKILLSNDDGIYADGINELYNTFHAKHDVKMMAPHEERSTTGHALSLATPLRVKNLSDNRFSCTGYPADCVLLALGHLYSKENQPDLVISGINHGANLGQDLYYSGTIAAAREASFHGIKSIATSLVLNNYLPPQFKATAKIVEFFVAEKIYDLIPEYCLLNLNFPNIETKEIKGIQFTRIGTQKYSDDVMERSDFRGNNYYWVGGHYGGFVDEAGTDCVAIKEGYIAVTLHNLLYRNVESAEAKLAKAVSLLNEKFVNDFKK